MEVKIQKLRPGAVTPRRGSADAAGYDLYACPADGQCVTIAPHVTAMIGTGLALAIPAGYFGGVFARSGLASKQGLRPANCVGVIDADTGEEALYGDDFTVEDIIWTGPQPTLRELGAEVGVTATFPMAELEKRLRKAVSLGRKIHYLPPYRGETKLQLSALLGIKPELLHDYKSVELMFAVAEMREKKSAEEVEAMERAFLIGDLLHTLAMKMCLPVVV